MESHGGDTDGVPVPVAIAACTAMTFFYVAILYSPTVVLRLPPPSSYKSFMIRRFICAAISTVVSLIVCAFILPIKSWEVSYLLSAYGIRLHHTWEGVVLPLFLTSSMYAGSFVLKIVSLWSTWAEDSDDQINLSFDGLKRILQKFVNWMLSLVDNISAWRIYIVAPLTEELVFRACMIPLLLCGGFKPYTVILLSPVFFSLAHLNHLLEFYMQQDSGFLRAAMVVGFQLGYTVIFGSYASFLFVRTGHIAAPLVSHVFCNYMGLPVFFSHKTGMVSVAFVAGVVSFVYLLFPLTSPDLYNNTTDDCKCWHRYCGWTN
ncbi:CAAX prenyl protease 2 [Rutidosis leptorrhynchoides]|uniref:CAAX prenyl protease 2 n=1 Tax=Rutidosis leptorrhynchoides TaxID=125765 RepID=UPI003A9963D9